MSIINIIKRDGSKEPLEFTKISRVVAWACEGLSGVSASTVELNSKLKFYDGMPSSQIQETLITSAAGLISETAPNYQTVASRLINYHIRKTVYSQPQPINLREHVVKTVNRGFYTPELLAWYDEDEFEQMNAVIDHDRDFDIAFAGMEQFRGKYLVQNRVTKEILETPQMAYMLIAACLFHAYPKNTRMKWVKDYYNAISKFEISLPTPIMAGLRTGQKQFSSCVLIDTDDSLNSIIATSGAIVKYVANKAGIGINGGSLRALNSPVRNGDTATTGPREFWKLFQASVKSVSQGGVRAASATLCWPFWHLDFEDLIVLRNANGTIFNRVNQLDYAVQMNGFMYDRIKKNQNITLFSPSDVPGLYDAFFADQNEFARLYKKYEADPTIRKKTLKAKDMFDMFLVERFNTGRMYIMNVDHANNHGAFRPDVAPVRMTNLCVEILLHTKPLEHLMDPNGEIALCILSAGNMAKLKTENDFKRIARLTVRGLDSLIDYQEYLLPAAENSTMKRRNIGIGLINLAYWMAKQGMTFTNADYTKLDEFAEMWAYYLTEASVELAEEFGPCPAWQDTKYSLGVTPNMTYKKKVDTLTPHVERLPWAELRERMKVSGIRNSTLMAYMPAETSAQTSNSTNGLNPVPALTTIKKSGDGVLRQVVPEVLKYGANYELKWNVKAIDAIKVCSIFGKYADQAISLNTPYNPADFPNGMIPVSVLGRDIMSAYSYGLATVYYNETNDGAGELTVDPELSAGNENEVEAKPGDCAGGGCSL